MERHPNRESAIGLYLRDHLGTDKVRISENPSTLVIVFCINDERRRLRYHPSATRCYAWEVDGRVTAVLHTGPVDSPLKAVRASILAEAPESTEAE